MIRDRVVGGVPPKPTRFTWAYLVLAPVYLAPLFVTHFLPAFDLPHHLAVADALMKAGPDSVYSKLYTAELRVAPFDTHFVLLLLLASFVSLSTAAKIVVGACVLALPLASARLLRASGRSSLPALLTFPLGYAMPLHYGLLAFVVAVPILVWAFAEVADRAAWQTRPLRQSSLLATLLFVLSFTHLEAWAVGSVALGVVLLQPISRRSRAFALVAVLPSLVPVGIYLTRMKRELPSSSGISLVSTVLAERRRELAEHGMLHDLVSRLRGIPIHLLRGFRDGSDIAWSYAFFIAVGVIALGAWASSGFSLPSRAWRPSAAFGLFVLLLLAYFGLPHHALPHAHSIYPRFALTLAVGALLLIPPSLASLSPRVLDLATGVGVLCLSTHALGVAQRYAAFGRELADFEQVLATVPPGRSAGGLVFDQESAVMNIDGLLSGMPTYYAIERRAPGSFSWLHYCSFPQLPCRVRDPAKPAALPFFSYPKDFDARRGLEELDLFLVRGGPSAELIFESETSRVQLLAAHGSWRAFGRR